MSSIRRITGAGRMAAFMVLIALPGVALGQAKLAISGSTSTVVGAGVDLTIEAYDGLGNIDTAYNGDKQLTFSGATASPNPPTTPTVSDKNGFGIPFGAATTITFVNGVATVSGGANGVMTLYRAKVDTIAVTDGTLSTLNLGDKLVITANPSTLSKFTLGLISPQFNGQPFTGANTLSALDIYGNTVKTFDAAADNVTISANSPLSGTITGLGTGNNNVLNRAADFIGGVAQLNVLGMRYTGSIGTGTFTAISSSGKSGTSGNVTITAGSATRLVLTGSGTQTAGAAQNLTIVAKDGANNTVTGYSGDKGLTFSGSGASPNPATQPTVSDKGGSAVTFGTSTTITFVNGVANVAGATNGVMRLYRAGTDTIAVTDGALSTTGADRLIVTVSAGAQGQFGVTLASPQTNGSVFTGTNRIVAQDMYGNPVASYDASANNVTVVSDAPLNGTIVGLGTGGLNVLNRASDFAGGVADLTALGMKYFGASGTGTLSVSSATGGTGTSNAITVTPGAAVKLAFIQQPSTSDANTSIAPPVTVQVRDTSNNNAAQAGVSVTMTLSSGTGVLSGTLTRATNAAGLATFDDLKVNQSGTKRLTASAAGLTPAVSDNFTIATASAPVINLWYGKRLTFRQIGVSQRWANIFGNVSDPDGILSLKYALNGGQQVNLTVGPDTRRLELKGDFNVDLTWQQLSPLPDSNRVVIIATDSLLNESRDTVIVRYHAGRTWPIPARVAWAGASSLSDSAQVVDGKWSVDGSGLLTIEPGYDRLVAIGDTTWTNYEATVPITVHEVTTPGPVSGTPSVGLFMRWRGHTDNPVSGWQPKQGWIPFGAGGFYSFEQPRGRMRIYTSPANSLPDPGKRMQLGVPYYFKMRCETTPTGNLYNFKMWAVGSAEPAGYDMAYLAPSSGPSDGSFLLLAHHVRATFGAVIVTTISGDIVPPVIDSITVNTGRTTAEVRWKTNENAFARVDFGLTTSYGSTITKDSLAGGQSILLTGLAENTLYHYRITSTDPSGNASATTDRFFVTKGSSTISSDDFNAPSLNTGLWNFVDPRGDGSRGVTGSQLSIGVPAGVEHDAWTGGNNTPRVIQATNDTDFEIEVKFDAPIPGTQGAGVLVQADLANYLRFDFFGDGTNTRAFAGVISNNTGSSRGNVVVGTPGIAPLYMRIKRERNVWTQWYSENGSTWTRVVTFTHDMQMTAIGLFALNYGSSPPAFTALVDYFRNQQTPRVRAAVKIALQGPYDPATGLMSNVLRTSGALGTRYPSRIIPTTAVDSINIEIRTAFSAAGSGTRKFAPAWLLRDGSIRDMADTTKTFVEYDTTDGLYFLVVRHGNHLPVMSAEAQPLSVSSLTTYDFTLGLTQAYGPEAMEQVTTSGPARFGLVAGNAAGGDARINAADRQTVKSQLNQTGYRTGDVTLNGVVDTQDQAVSRTNTGRETDIP